MQFIENRTDTEIFKTEAFHFAYTRNMSKYFCTAINRVIFFKIVADHFTPPGKRNLRSVYINFIPFMND